MQLEEPHALPSALDLDAIGQLLFYCLVCGQARQSEADIRIHWRAGHMTHGEDANPENGIDYARGTQVLLMALRRREWVRSQTETFAALMHPGFGPEDFLAEAEIRD
jgi:hypothetical protein